MTQRLGASIGHGHLVRNPIRSDRKSVVERKETLKTPKSTTTRGEGAKARQASSIGLIIRQKEPKVLETPVDRVDSFLTPTELFYVRSHSAAPKLKLASYRLHIDGAVKSPFSLTYQELRDMPAGTRLAVLECAGNSRVFLVPRVQGAQWELGAVVNAAWTGLPLCACWSGPVWKKTLVRSCTKDPIAEYRSKGQYLRARSPIPVVCREQKRFSAKCCSPTR